jgi:hypothetical protein
MYIVNGGKKAMNIIILKLLEKTGVLLKSVSVFPILYRFLFQLFERKKIMKLWPTGC